MTDTSAERVAELAEIGDEHAGYHFRGMPPAMRIVGEILCTQAATLRALAAERNALRAENEGLREFAEFLAKIEGRGVQVVGVTQGIRDRARAALRREG